MADLAQAVTSTPDPTTRILPALSATSDAPAVETPPPADPEPLKPEVSADTPKPEATPDPETPETPEGDGDGGEKHSKKELEPWAKAEITKARNQKREAEATRAAAEARAATAEANLKKALDAVEKLTGESALSARKAITAEDPRPKREAFDNPDAYDSALVEWAGRTAATAATAAVEAKAAEDKARTDKESSDAANKRALEELSAAFGKRKSAFMADHPDYEDVAESDGIKVTTPMAHVIWHDEDGPAIAYYLGQNPDEAERISALPPARVGTELGRIAARLNAKPVVSTKPKPIKPLRAEETVPSRKSTDEESMEEYGARRLSELRGKPSGAGLSH